MKNILVITAFLVLGVVGVTFAILNSTSVDVDLYFLSFTTPLALLVVLSLLLGAVLGMIASAALFLSQKREILRLRRRNGSIEKELQNLRELPIKDRH